MKTTITLDTKDAEALRDIVQQAIDDLGPCDHFMDICVCEEKQLVQLLDDKINGRVE